MSITDPVLSKACNHLHQLLNGSVPYNSQVVDPAVSKLSLDSSFASLVSQHLSEIIPLLVSILKTPPDSDSAIDYNQIVQFLDLALSTVSSSTVFQDYLSLEDLVAGLKSGFPPLQTAFVGQIARTSPPDIISNTPLLELLIELLLSTDTDPNVANEIVKALVALASDGELVRRKLFSPSGECGSRILQVINTPSGKSISTPQCRVMSLITDIVPYDVSSHHITAPFLQFPPESIYSDSDVLLVLNKLQFYRDLVSNPHSSHLLDQINSQIDAIGRLYTKRDEPDVESFLLNELFTFFGALSSVDPQRFAALDEQYNITSSKVLTDYKSKHTIMFLSLLGPAYLANKLPTVVSSVPITPHTVRALRNFARNEKCFILAFDRPEVPREVAKLPYYELMALLDVVSSKPYGIDMLLNHWPAAMDQLLWNEDVRDRDSISFRHEVFDNLVRAPSSQLGTWNDQIRAQYRALVNNVRNQDPEVAIMDKNA